MKRLRGQRVLDGVSGARAGGRVQPVSKASNTASFENGIRLKTAMISLGMQPPPPAVIAHDKVSFQVFYQVFKIRSATPETQIVQPLRPSAPPAHSNPLTCFAFGAVVVGWCVSLLFEADETQAPRLRNFDTDPPSSYCYEF
jgi:hypothetical protein